MKLHLVVNLFLGLYIVILHCDHTIIHILKISKFMLFLPQNIYITISNTDFN